MISDGPLATTADPWLSGSVYVGREGDEGAPGTLLSVPLDSDSETPEPDGTPGVEVRHDDEVDGTVTAGAASESGRGDSARAKKTRLSGGRRSSSLCRVPGHRQDFRIWSGRVGSARPLNSHCGPVSTQSV